jgi:hypothetical protein
VQALAVSRACATMPRQRGEPAPWRWPACWSQRGGEWAHQVQGPCHEKQSAVATWYAMVQNGVMNTPHAKVKPIRLSIPISPEVHTAFSRMATARSISIGRAMGEWLLDTLDAADQVATMLENARAAPRQAALQLHAYAMGLSDETGTLLEQIRRESGAAGLVDAQRPQPGRSGPLTPPSSNTGGKVPKNTNQPKRGKP